MPLYATATCAAFVEYWFTLPRTGKIPTFAAFLDRPMLAIQPKVAMTEIISDTDIRYRLIGTEWVDSFGRGRRGETTPDAPAPPLRPELVAFFRKIVETPIAARTLVHAATSHGREIVFEA